MYSCDSQGDATSDKSAEELSCNFGQNKNLFVPFVQNDSSNSLEHVLF